MARSICILIFLMSIQSPVVYCLAPPGGLDGHIRPSLEEMLSIRRPRDHAINEFEKTMINYIYGFHNIAKKSFFKKQEARYWIKKMVNRLSNGIIIFGSSRRVIAILEQADRVQYQSDKHRYYPHPGCCALAHVLNHYDSLDANGRHHCDAAITAYLNGMWDRSKDSYEWLQKFKIFFSYVKPQFHDQALALVFKGNNKHALHDIKDTIVRYFLEHDDSPVRFVGCGYLVDYAMGTRDPLSNKPQYPVWSVIDGLFAAHGEGINGNISINPYDRNVLRHYSGKDASERMRLSFHNQVHRFYRQLIGCTNSVMEDPEQIQKGEYERLFHMRMKILWLCQFIQSPGSTTETDLPDYVLEAIEHNGRISKNNLKKLYLKTIESSLIIERIAIQYMGAFAHKRLAIMRLLRAVLPSTHKEYANTAYNILNKPVKIFISQMIQHAVNDENVYVRREAQALIKKLDIGDLARSAQTPDQWGPSRIHIEQSTSRHVLFCL
ncbi:MAG: hypothetical protein GF384_00865 [Elusimicrobia bacterium]|nr:hypothetical protein [Elusimicrobiota bacterium]MBD3411607.1 hypothetical protein [Elusimicrobiota bacterium]